MKQFLAFSLSDVLFIMLNTILNWDRIILYPRIKTILNWDRIVLYPRIKTISWIKNVTYIPAWIGL